MRAIASPMERLNADEASRTEWGGEWLALLAAPETLLGAAVLLTFVCVFALGVGNARPERAVSPRRHREAGGRRRIEVVELDLEGFTDAELARLVRLQRLYRRRHPVIPPADGRRRLR